MNKISLVAAALLMFASAVAYAKPPTVTCTQKTGAELGVNNEQVLEWIRNSTKEFVRGRAHISGKVVKVLPSDKVKNPEKEGDKYKGKHQRFEVKIGPGKMDVIQVFYHGKYTPRPTLKKGDLVEACGEFAADMTGDPKVSSHFAVLYWVHAATTYPHPEGYVASDGQTYGTKVAKK